MTTGDPIAPLGAVRVGDAERTATADRLAAHAAAGHPIVPLFIAAALLWAAGHRTGRPPRHVTTPS